MSQINKINNHSILDIDESNKNEEDLLSFSNKYKTAMYKDEDEFKEIEYNKRKISVDSTSNSFSQDNSKLSINSKKINNVVNKDISNSNADSNETKSIYEERQRKMSSPICFYYDGSDKILSKMFKNNIDIKNSINFIKKEVFFNKSSKIIYNMKKNNKFYNEFNQNNLNFNLYYKNNNYISNVKYKEFINNNEKLSFNNDNKIDLNLNCLFIPEQNINNNLCDYNALQNQLYDMNYINNINNIKNNLLNNNINKRKLSYNNEERIINNYYNKIFNQNNNYQNQETNYYTMLFSYNNNNNENNLQDNSLRTISNKSIRNFKYKIDKKPFDKRKGDWLCPKCHNLNFTFRIICNRCKIPKPKNINSGTIVNKNQ